MLSSHDIPVPKCLLCNDMTSATSGDAWGGEVTDDFLAQTRITFSCQNESCFMDDFPAYRVTLDGHGKMWSQEYGIDKIWIKVYPDSSCIYRVEAFLLLDEVKIPRALWLNAINRAEVLDKIRFVLTFS